MIALLALLNWINHRRQEIRFGLLVLALDLILLAAVEAWVVHCHHLLFDPWVAGIGVAWITITALILWCLGGLVVDLVLVGRLLGSEPAQAITKAVNAMFLAQATIVVFFSLLPVWAWWGGFLLALVAVVGAATATALAPEVKPNWKRVYIAYQWLLISLLVAIVLIALFQMVFSARWPNWDTGWKEWLRERVKDFSFPSPYEMREGLKKGLQAFKGFIPHGGVIILAGLLFLASYLLARKLLRIIAITLLLLWAIWAVDGVGAVCRFFGLPKPAAVSAPWEKAPPAPAVVPRTKQGKREWVQKIHLSPGVWSRWFMPPPGVRILIGAPPDTVYQLRDGRIYPFSHRLGINRVWLKGFRLRSSQGGKAEVAFIKY